MYFEIVSGIYIAGILENIESQSNIHLLKHLLYIYLQSLYGHTRKQL